MNKGSMSGLGVLIVIFLIIIEPVAVLQLISGIGQLLIMAGEFIRNICQSLIERIQ